MPLKPEELQPEPGDLERALRMKQPELEHYQKASLRKVAQSARSWASLLESQTTGLALPLGLRAAPERIVQQLY